MLHCIALWIFLHNNSPCSVSDILMKAGSIQTLRCCWRLSAFPGAGESNCWTSHSAAARQLDRRQETCGPPSPRSPAPSCWRPPARRGPRSASPPSWTTSWTASARRREAQNTTLGECGTYVMVSRIIVFVTDQCSGTETTRTWA